MDRNKVIKPKIRIDWGVKEFSWIFREYKVVLTESEGIPTCLTWEIGKIKQIASLPMQDNLWLPEQVITCIKCYSSQNVKIPHNSSVSLL